MSNKNKSSNILDEKATVANPISTGEEELKLDTIVVNDEEEKAILRKIDLQYVSVQIS
jgi:hypothetical protein